MIQYKIKIAKTAVEQLRYGRTITGERSRPWLAPITKEWFLTRNPLIKPNLLIEPNSKQVLIPSKVNDLGDAYEITGQLIFKEYEGEEATEEEITDEAMFAYFTEEAIHAYFIQNSEYIQRSETLFELKGCRLMVDLDDASKKLMQDVKDIYSKIASHGLFKKPEAPDETTAKLALLTEMISPYFNNQPPCWKYSKAKDTAFIYCPDEEVLKAIQQDILAKGTPPECIQLGKTKADNQPILLIHSLKAMTVKKTPISPPSP